MLDQHQLEIVIALLGAVLAFATVARRVLIPYPIFLVLGGLVIRLLPNVPIVRLDPDLVFLVILPPVLFLATTGVVAMVARFVMPGLSWLVAVALGAIVSPPDAVAASAIARRLGIPYRIVTVLEGKSLINEAAALVLYRSAVAAAVTGTFSLTDALWQFVVTSAGGVLIGLIVGWIGCWALRLTEDSLTETAITLLAPYAAWLLAERTHTSGVLACVAGGLYTRQFFSAVVAPATRMQARAHLADPTRVANRAGRRRRHRPQAGGLPPAPPRDLVGRAPSLDRASGPWRDQRRGSPTARAGTRRRGDAHRPGRKTFERLSQCPCLSPIRPQVVIST
jgi:CPA1 family monovalent cation:H+ antiporter